MRSRAWVWLAALALAGAAPERAGAATFSTSTPIAIPDSGAGTPYPSDIAVSGLTGTVATVTVTLTNFNHICPKDVDVLLVGPSGANVLLMSDTGDCTETARPDATLTFDDAAPSGIPCRNASPRTTQPITPTTGTYKPTEVSGPGGAGDLHCETNHTPIEPDSLLMPAPQAPYGKTLSVLSGTDPNGTWHLYVDDDSSLDSGSIAGWSLTITTSAVTTTTLPGCASAPTYPSIECREDALIAAVQASTAFMRAKLKTLVLSQAQRLKADTVKAQGQSKSKRAKDRLKIAIRDVTVLVSRLNSLNARHTVSADGRSTLIGLATPIRMDLITLRKSL